MGKRTDKDLDDRKRLSQHDPAYVKAEMLDRPVGGVSFKAHQLNLSLRPGSGLDPGPAGFEWED